MWMIKDSEGVSMMSMNSEGVSMISRNRLIDYEQRGCEHDEFEQCEWLWTVRVWAWYAWSMWMIMNIEGVSIMSMKSVIDYEQWGCEHDE
jgi:hypothetical protein